MKIIIENTTNASWKTIEVVAKPSNKVSTLKKAIQNSKGVPLESQRLTYRNVELENDKMLVHYNMEDGSRIRFSVETTQLNVTVFSPSVFAVAVDPWDSVDNLKKAIEETQGISASKILIFGDSSRNEFIHGKRCLMHFYVHEGRQLFLETLNERDVASISVRTTSGKQVELLVSLTMSVSALKNQFLRRLVGNNSNHGDKVRLIYKEKIIEDENSKLADFQITSGASLDAVPQSNELHMLHLVRKNGEELSIADVSCLDTILAVKRKVELATGIPCAKQRLKIVENMNKPRYLKNEARTLFDYGLVDGPFVLHLDSSRVVCVANEMLGHIYLDFFQPTEPDEPKQARTIRSIKEEIDALYGVSVEDQILSFNGQTIDDEDRDLDKKLSRFGIEQMSELRLVVRRRRTRSQVNVNMNFSQRQIKLDVASSETLVSIKTKLAKMTGLETIELYDSDGNALIEDAAIDWKKMSKLSAKPKSESSIKFSVRSLSGQVLEISAPNCQTISELKVRIAPKFDLPAERQRLIHNSKVLLDASTISDCGIANGTVVHLVSMIHN